MNNEPVAWMDEETGCFVYSQYDYEDLDEHGKDGLIPLYTHPVKENWKCSAPPCKCDSSNYKVCGYSNYTHPAELTDEEIHKEFLELVKECDPMLSIASVGFPDLIADFAKAILRKAQEK